jgi:SAM-dependent methyltransferase
MNERHASSSSSYDDIPYESRAQAHSHPDRLATVGTLFGLEPPDPLDCRVLELGCAGGENLFSMAVGLPHSSFLGIDLSPRQIEEGQTVIEAIGLTNVELRSLSIMDLDESFGSFDYIVAHGVYSWVSRKTQERILGICAELLAPDGLAYVSYNTYPGWHQRGMVREMLRYHAAALPEVAEQLVAAHELLSLLATSMRGRDTPFVKVINEELEQLDGLGDSYLFHEHLEEHNEALYFHEFAERAEAAGLRYVSDARVASTMIDKSPAEVRRKLRSMSNDRIQTEQYLDFLRNRTFRRSILCDSGAEPSLQPIDKRIERLFVGAAVGEEALEGLEIRSELIRGALNFLVEQRPAWVRFEEVLHAAREYAGAKGDDDVAKLCAGLFECFVADLVEFHSIPPGFLTSVSERPAASPLARYEAERGTRVTNMRHEPVSLGEVSRLILRLLDGTRDRAALIAEIETLAKKKHLELGGLSPSNGSFTDGTPPTIEGILDEFARNAILIA